MARPDTILVVEDNDTTARTLLLFLAGQGYRATRARDGREAQELFAAHDVALVVLDLMLPDVDGLAVCRWIRGRSAVPIVMLTARTAEDDVVEGLESGADDYVCKPFGSRELLARIRRCLERTRRDGPGADIVRIGEIELDAVRRAVSVGGAAVKLTRSEFDILATLMRSPGRVYTRGQLIQHALGDDFDGLDRTVDTHVWSLRRKIGEPRGRPRYIRAEQGVGYRLSDPDGS